MFEFLGLDGKPTVVPERRVIRNNFIIANWNAAWPIDHDDGSSYYLDAENVLMYAGTKTYLGGHSVNTTGNLMLWPNMNGWGAAAMCYASAVGASGFDEHWANNTVVLGPPGGASRGDGYTDFSSCVATNLRDPPTPAMADNVVHTPLSPSNFSVGCGKGGVPFASWQADGRDAGTRVVHGAPPAAALVRQARRLLGV